ncbi:MAG: hypothetical protein ACYCVB_13485 [Bacilli bacterium]
MRQTYKFWVTGAVAAAIAVSPLTAGFAFADTAANGAFTASYQHNAGIESGLAQQAQAGMTTSPTAQEQAAQTAVQAIAGQVTTLYGSEQALAGSASTLPSINTFSNPRISGSIASMSRQRASLVNAADRAWQQMNLFKHRRNRTKYNQAVHMHAALESKLGYISREITRAKGELTTTSWNGHPYDYALSSLQHTILQLQQAQIHYTRTWIALEKAASTSTTPAPAPQSVSIAEPSGMPLVVPTSIAAAFSINGSTAQQVTVPVTDFNNGILTFDAPSGLAAGTYTVTVTFTVNGATYTSTGSYTVG